MVKHTLTSALLCLSFLFMAGGCSSDDKAVEITDVRRAPAEARVGVPELDTASRMGLSPVPPLSAAENSRREAFFYSAQLRWNTPETWRVADERAMRLATLVPENAPNTECVISVLAGDAGGVGANINRWRGQIGLGPLSEIEIAELPRWEILGRDAVYLDAVGESETEADAPVFLGLICPVPGHTLFVRMSGPQAEVAPERERFRQLCLSFHIEAPSGE